MQNLAIKILIELAPAIGSAVLRYGFRLAVKIISRIR